MMQYICCNVCMCFSSMYICDVVYVCISSIYNQCRVFPTGRMSPSHQPKICSFSPPHLEKSPQQTPPSPRFYSPPHQGLIPHPPLKNSFHFRTIHILTSHSLYTQDRVSPSGGDCTPPPPPLFEKLA